MDLRDLLTIFRARWIVIVLATLLGGLLALGFSLAVTPTYQSKVQFYVTVAGGENAAAAAYQGSLGAQQRVQSYAALVHSADIAGQVIERTGVDLTPEEVVHRTQATGDAETVLLDVSVADSDPSRALSMAKGIEVVLPEVIRSLETPDGGGPALAKLTVVNPPLLPSEPVAPKVAQNIGLGVAAGLLLGMGAAILATVLDRRVKTQHDLANLSEKPVVGSIPFRGKEDRSDGNEHIVPFREGHSLAAESFRRLRTNLQFLKVDSPPKVFVLTSSVATEGKSETAVNLALTLAEAGHKTLLIEADLRRPKVVSYMSMPNKVGLTNVLTGQAEFDDVVQHTQFSEVDLLACGPLPPNPSELLSSVTFGALLTELRKIYEYVIIDSPPLLPVTDAAVSARFTDGALLVVRSNRTTRDQVEQAVESLKKANADLLGFILVANKPVSHRASYYDSYYSTAG